MASKAALIFDMPCFELLILPIFTSSSTHVSRSTLPSAKTTTLGGGGGGDRNDTTTKTTQLPRLKPGEYVKGDLIVSPNLSAQEMGFILHGVCEETSAETRKPIQNYRSAIPRPQIFFLGQWMRSNRQKPWLVSPPEFKQIRNQTTPEKLGSSTVRPAHSRHVILSFIAPLIC